ncbi:glycosyl transferase family 2 [Paenibacillus methanolicus]|uniref:Glycosyl transferase family 2 n=2 Tax=Paenibacillus methanolicus TaxID=582686 RepID=A0A5S5CJH1_9BACL|nr:glycosyl transferase family 2 [Paenibacillus methanolicus]
MGKMATAKGVSIIVCTNRPQFFDNLIRNFLSQQYRNKELIIILNKDNMDLGYYRSRTSAYANISVYQVPERISLGQALNGGITRTKFPLIAKFDDDDYYSPYYLNEQVKALARTNSDIVGKHSCLVHLTASGKLLIRSPKERNKRTVFVQGGTILFKRRVLEKVRFPDKSVGEDTTFLFECEKKGFKAYATSPFNYVYMRRGDKKTHTWRANDTFYLQGSIVLGVTQEYRKIADRKA